MREPIRVLELRSVWGTGGGPDKTILNGTKLTDPSRIAITVCYIRDARDTVFSIDKRARELGLDYVEVLERNSYDIRIWPALRRIIHDRRIQIIHSHDQKTDVLAWALSRVEAVVPLATAHGFAGRSWNERFYYGLEKRLLARFKKVVAVSQKIRAELIRTGSKPERVVVINNGIDHEAFRRNRACRQSKRIELGIDPNAPVIGAVGRLEDEKRFDLLLEAFGGLRASHPGAVLVIVGEGSLRASLEAIIQKLGLTEAVVLAGHRSDVIDLHSTFDVFVQSSEREGTPNAVLEAMALETPVVATDAGGTTEIMTNGVHGLIVAIRDVPALQAALECALTSPETAAWTKAARASVETELSFRRRMEKFERVYQDLVAGGSS